MKDHGMDTVMYAQDPASSNKVVSVLTEHGKFEVKEGVVTPTVKTSQVPPVQDSWHKNQSSFFHGYPIFDRTCRIHAIEIESREASRALDGPKHNLLLPKMLTTADITKVYLRFQNYAILQSGAGVAVEAKQRKFSFVSRTFIGWLRKVYSCID